MRLLKALLNGKPPPEEEDGEEEEDDDEAYPVNESGAKQEAAPAKAEEAGAAKAAPAAEAAQEAELTTKLQTLSFSTAGELSIASPEPEAEPFTLPRPSWASLPLQPTSTPYPYPYPYPYPHPYPHPYPYPHPHPSPGKLGISLEKNVVAKVGDPDTQAAAKGVQPGWVLVSIAGAQVEEDKAAGEPPRR